MDYNCKRAFKICDHFVMAWVDKSVSKIFSLHYPSNPLKKFPSLLHLEIFISVPKFTKNYNFIHLIGPNFEHFQRISRSAQKLLLPLFSTHSRNTSEALRLCETLTQNIFHNIPFLCYLIPLYILF